MNINDFEFFDKAKIYIQHPYQHLNSKKQKDKIPEIRATAKMCTFYKGRLYGLAKIQYSTNIA